MMSISETVKAENNGTTALHNENENKNVGGKVKHCAVCGSVTPALYQNDMCKKCLLSSFKKLVKMIDDYRTTPRNKN